jgi:tRNA pseudouridine55 synthase
MAKRRGDPVNGVLLLDKPPGLSSNHALQRARRHLNARKAGHTGTLDPFATGLLVLCFGEATKWSGDLLHADKAYLATLSWGSETDSADLTGNITRQAAPGWRAPAPEVLEGILKAHTGPQQQLPPMYSALKRDGKALYEYAREGIEVDREPRQVTIHSLVMKACDAVGCDIEVYCSKGTYVRTLAEDIGRAAGCLAHLSALRRTQTAGFKIDLAITLEAFEALSLEAARALLLPIEALLPDAPVLVLDAEQARRFSHGQTLRLGPGDSRTSRHETAVRVRVRDADGHFLGTGLAHATRLQPDRLIMNEDIQ